VRPEPTLAGLPAKIFIHICLAALPASGPKFAKGLLEDVEEQIEHA
jgi:hypothetical protein